MEQGRPIFVAGSQRSGTTMLQSVLGRHSRIAAAPELYFWLRVYLVRDELGSLDDDDNLKRVVERSVDVPFRLWEDARVTTGAVVERVRAAPRRDYRTLLQAIMSEFAFIHGKPRWSEKSPGQQVNQILAMAPDAKIIHIVRHVEDVVASSRAVPWESGGPYALGVQWSSFNLTAMREGFAAGPDSYLRIRYEDFVLAPEQTLTHICAFIGEESEPAMLESAPSTAVPEVGRTWQGQAEGAVAKAQRRPLSAYSRLQVQAASRRVAPVFGYRPPRRHRATAALAIVASLPPIVRIRWQGSLERLWSPKPVGPLESVERFLDEQRKRLEDHGVRIRD